MDGGGRGGVRRGEQDNAGIERARGFLLISYVIGLNFAIVMNTRANFIV